MKSLPAASTVAALLLSLILFANASAQELCGMRTPAPASAMGKGANPSTPASVRAITSHTGCHLPADGTVRGMVLYVRTLDDNSPDAEWNPDSIPRWAAKFESSLPEYFAHMTDGKFKLELTTWPELLVTPNSLWTYLNQTQWFGDATRDLLKTLSQKTTFDSYDNWNSESRPYNVTAGADGKVDLIFVMWRRVEDARFLPFAGVSDLGFAGYLFADDSLKTYFYGGSGNADDAGSSGVTITRSPGSQAILDYDFAYRVGIHELMHKVYGEGHPAAIYGGLGVMGNSGNGLAFNSFEKNALGYMQYNYIPAHEETIVTLHDYLTHNEAWALPIGIDNRYYTLEYRTKADPYDTAPAKGLYIYRVYDSDSRTQKELQVMSADGNWQWMLDTTSGMIVHKYPDALTGYSVYQKIPVDGRPYWAPGWAGDPASAFTMQRPKFSVLGNPTPDFILYGDTVRTNLHLYLLSTTDSTATVYITYTPPNILSAETAAAGTTTLAQSWPNPVTAGRGVAQVSFTLAHASDVTLTVYDATGRVVSRPQTGPLDAGTHTRLIDVRSLHAGTYWYVLQDGQTSLRRSFSLLR